MKSSCGNYVLVYNGEIYNAPYLKNKYLKNVNLSGRSDTEILLELLARFSLEEFINKIDGMFAFAIYSSIDNSVKLVRDRSGQNHYFTIMIHASLFLPQKYRPSLQAFNSIA